jgi:hypothetical protein
MKLTRYLACTVGTVCLPQSAKDSHSIGPKPTADRYTSVPVIEGPRVGPNLSDLTRPLDQAHRAYCVVEGAGSCCEKTSSVTGHCLDAKAPWHEQQPGEIGATRLGRAASSAGWPASARRPDAVARSARVNGEHHLLPQ